MGHGIGAEHDEHGGDLANHDSKCGRRPASVVGERGEDINGRLLRGKDPEDDNDGEEGEDVNGHEDTFSEGEAFGGEDVEESDADYRRPDEKGTLPAGGNVVRVIEDDEALDDDADNVRVNGDDALPGYRR